MKIETVRNKILPWIGLIFFLGAIWISHRLLAEDRFHEVLHELGYISPVRVGEQAFCTVVEPVRGSHVPPRGTFL